MSGSRDPRAAQLRRRLAEDALREPEQREFLARLAETVERIEREFQGTARRQLLDEVEATWSRQARVREGGRRAVQALHELEAAQRRLLAAVSRLVRPSDATLH